MVPSPASPASVSCFQFKLLNGDAAAPAAGYAPLPAVVDTPDPATCCGHVEEDEAVENGRVATVQGGNEVPGRVADEVSEGHLTGQHEGHRSGVQAKQQQHTANGLDHRCYPEQREDLRPHTASTWREAEQLLSAVLKEDEGGDDAEHAK